MAFQDVDDAILIEGLSSKAKLVLVVVCKFANKKSKETYVSKETIIKKTSLSRASVCRATNELKGHGFVSIRESRTDSRQYWVVYPERFRDVASVDAMSQKETSQSKPEESHIRAHRSGKGKNGSHIETQTSHCENKMSHHEVQMSRSETPPNIGSGSGSGLEKVYESDARENSNSQSNVRGEPKRGISRNFIEPLTWDYALHIGRSVGGTDAQIRKVWQWHQDHTDDHSSGHKGGTLLSLPPIQFARAVELEISGRFDCG